MAGKVIRPARRETLRRHCLEYHWADRPSAGFSFDCDENGVVDVSALPSWAAANYLACVNGEYDVVFAGIQMQEWTVYVPAVLLCNCGREVRLQSFTNMCDCGADYNHAGACLAPRGHWGEETGETAADVLGPGTI